MEDIIKWRNGRYYKKKWRNGRYYKNTKGK